MADWISPAWSDWVKARMQIVGIESASDLAVQIGLPLPDVERLLRMQSPPHTLRGRPLLNLARALGVTQRVLLFKWRFIAPSDVGRRELRPRGECRIKPTATGIAHKVTL
jgi:hypothetical protein